MKVTELFEGDDDLDDMVGDQAALFAKLKDLDSPGFKEAVQEIARFHGSLKTFVKSNKTSVTIDIKHEGRTTKGDIASATEKLADFLEAAGFKVNLMYGEVKIWRPRAP